MTLSRLRQEAQKEREEAQKKQNAQRQTANSASGAPADADYTVSSRLQAEALRERLDRENRSGTIAIREAVRPPAKPPAKTDAETSKTTRTATGGGAQSGGPDGERRAAAGMGTRTSTTVQSEIDALKKYRNVLLTERSREMEKTDAPADGGKLRDLTEQIRTISERMNALDDEKNRLSDIERQALLDSGEIEDSDWWDIVVKSLNSGVKSLNSGVAQFNNAFASTADFLLPTDFLGEYDPASRFSDWTQKKYEQAERERQETLIGRGKASQIISDLGTAAVAALPQSILAMFSGGASAAAQGGAALTAGAVSPGVAEMANNAIRSMSKNPQYWMSFIQTLGTDYDEAKSNGASNAEAAVTAVLSSAVNAAIEIGGGIETLPENLKSGDTSRILSWVRSMGEEGMEEVEQRLVSGATQKAVYDQDKPVYSTTDENAIVNPAGMARDFLMGAGVAGILGGGQVVGVKAMNAYYDAKAKTAQAVQDAKAKAVQAAMQAQERKVQAQQAAWEKANAHFEVPEDVADVPYTQVEQDGKPVDNPANTVDNDIMEAGRAETENTPAAERTATETDETRTSEEVIPSEEKPATTARSAGKNDILPVPVREYDTRGSAVNMLTRTAQEAKMGENGVRAIGEWYDETENPQIAPYFGAFAAYYNGGRNGLDYDAIHSGQASAVTEVVRRAAYNAGRMDAIEAATKSAPEPVANPAQRGYTEGVKTGETAKTPKYKTIRTKKSDWAATDITWYAPHQKSPIAYSTVAVRDLIGAMVDDNQTATVRELQAKIKYDQDAKKVLQQYIDAGYGDDTASDYFGDEAGTGKPAAAAAKTQQKPKPAAKTQQDGERKPAEHVPLNTDKELDAVLNLGTGTAGGERRVREFYNNNPGVSVKEATDFLKKEFGIGGRSHRLSDGTWGFADWDAKGIRLWVTPGGDEHTFTWAQADARYRAIYGVESTVDQKSLTDGELYALTEYKSSESYKINAALRDGDELDERQKSFVEDMDSGLKKLPVHRGIVYRNIGFDDFGGKEARDEFVKSHVEGVPVIYSAYTSASTKVDGYIVEDEFVVHMQIVSENGRNLEGIGNNFESEILFERGSFFVPQRVEYASDGTPTIYLTEVTESERTGEKGAGGSLRGDHRGQPKASSDSQDSEVRDVPAIHSVQSDVQEVSERDTRGHSERKGSVPDVQTEVKRASSPQQQIAGEVRKYIESGKSFSAARLFEIADQAYGGTMAEGTYTVKDAYDGMELAVNQYLMQSEVVKNGNGDAKAAKATLDKMVELLSKLPTQTKRTAEMEEYQQFSTPPNIAYLAAWTANVDASDVVLEPSAGIGGLALWPKAWGATVYANELSTRRLAFLNQLGLDGTFNLNAEQIDNLLPDSIKPSVVIMNPPFSSAAGRMTKNDTANAKRHIEQALDRLEDGGRLVAILGNGMADDAKGFKTWWNGLRKEYNVRANVQIDGKNYRKYGTTFNVQLAVIDKIGPNTAPTMTGTVTDLAKIPEMMEGIRNDRNRSENSAGTADSRVSERRTEQKPADRNDGRQPAGSAERAGRDPAGHDAAVRDDGADGKRRRTQPAGDRKDAQGNAQRDTDGVRGKGSRADGRAADKLELERTKPAAQPALSELSENPDSDVQYMKETVLTNDKKDHPERWTTTRAGDPNKTPMRLSEIIEQIRHDFGLNITTGHIRGSDTRGQYNRRDHGIRSRIANDLPTIAHELGHHFDEMFGLQDGITEDMRQELLDKLEPDLAKRYSKKKLLGEGIAEYVRKFLQNREVAAIDYPQFHDYFMKQFTGKDLALIEQLADEINAYYSMDADTATSSIRLREEGAPDARTFGEKIRDKMSVLYQAWVDSNEGIKRFDRATGSNTYIMASNAAYSDAMAGAIITGDLTDANGNYVAPGLKTALHGLNMQDEAEYRLFGEYLVVKHGPERLNEGMRIFADDRKNSTQWMNARQAELEAQYPQFAEISDRLYQFQKDFLATWGVATGLVSQESADEWADRWAYYVPFNRAVSEDKRGGGAKRGFANQNSTIKKARGSGLEIIHPVDNIINNIVRMVNAGVRNNVMRAITDAAQTMGADAAFLEQVPAPLTRTAFSMAGVKQDLTAMLEESSLTDIDKAQAQNIVGTLDNILYQYGRGKAHGDTITVLKGGKPEFWKINDSQLLDSLTSMSQPQMHGILDAYGRISRFMTSNITGSNVIWSIFSNLPRDLGTFFTYSKNKNIAKMAAGVGSAYLNKAKGDNASPLYKEYLAMGGGNESMYSADRDLAKKARKKLEGKKINLNPLDWITFVSDTVESGPRFATYKLLREAGMTPQEAFFEATDITVNFRRGGTWARQVNKVAPFFNANVQGLDKFFRWISGEEASRLGKDRKKLVRTRAMQYLVASIVLAAIQALHIMAGDDEDKEKAYAQLSSFMKNSYWNFFMGDGKFFAVPKPREIAVLSSFFERCIELYIADNEHAFDEFYVYATDNFFPAFASDLLQLPVNGPKETMGSVIGNFGLLGAFGYISANRDFLGRPIVSSGLQNLEPKDQYTERTSKLAYWMGQAFDESPAMIDYFFEQTLGGWWKYQKVIFPVGEDARDLSLGIRNSYVKDSQYSTDLVNWMYDKASASQSAKNSDPSNMEKAITARMDNNMTSFYSRYYSQAKKVRETDRSRNVRQTVLDMIREYQKASDHGELTAAQEAVYAVCEKAGSTEYLPSVMQVSIKDGSDRTHELSAIQYVEYQTDYNRLYWEYVEDKLGGAKTQAQKVAVLKAAKDVAREEATNRTLARIGAPKTDFEEKYAGLDAEDVVTFKAQLDLADDDDGSVQQAEFVDIILNMGLDDEEIYTLYFSKYDSETAYEAREVGIPADVYFPAKTEMANIKADKDENGKSISGSRRKKIEAYLNTVAQDYKQYLWLLGTEYESIFKDPDYIRFFGRK